MKRLVRFSVMAALALATVGCGHREARLDIAAPNDYEGKSAEIISYEDSLVIANAIISNGKAFFTTVESDSVKYPLLAQVNIDGHTVAFYVIEPGEASLTVDSMSVASGTNFNNRLSAMMARLDSAENVDMNSYTALAEQLYKENRDNVLGTYAAIEWLKFGDPVKVTEMIRQAPEHLRNSKRAAKYVKYAELRAKTAPGHPYIDFDGENAEGNPVKFSSLITPGKYTLVDFMASWCPYCIKDIKAIKALQQQYAGKGLNTVSVAVRDTPEDTRRAVASHGIAWPVVYNAQRRPYDIYGFSGIPHYMLIGPDGKILLRTETLADAEAFLGQNMKR
ncbi:MAG: TlpA family protein disulfide reductase [Muribaculum sp.]|nr:TlpA family protein disulfide reductase [Muribaculum sp.]